MKITLFLATSLFTVFAGAAIEGWPQGGSEVAQTALENDAVEVIAGKYDCELSAKQIKAVDAQFSIENPEPQEEDYASYAGELSSFTMNVTAELPAACEKAGRYSCTMNYDLYDEEAYQVDNSTVSCSQVP